MVISLSQKGERVSEKGLYGFQARNRCSEVVAVREVKVWLGGRDSCRVATSAKPRAGPSSHDRIEDERVAGCQGRNSQLVDHGRLNALPATHSQSGALEHLERRSDEGLSEICMHTSDRLQGLRSNAFFQRFFGSSNFTPAGSNASGSTLPPAHRSVDSCS